jgi:L-asparaginase
LHHPRPTPHVHVISLGGTIAMAASPAGGVTPALSVDQLLTAVPGLASLDLTIEATNFRQLPGASLSFDDLHGLLALIDDVLRSGVDGVVVAQGTDTIEETAYLLDLRHTGPQPIVVTGAMRNSTMAGADGPANLLAAVQTAASPAARNLGCVVVLADEVHAARRVRKTHSISTSTFQSPVGGPLGYLVEGELHLLSAVPHRTVVPAPARAWKPRIGLATVVLDDDAVLLENLAGRVDGLVIAAFGAGHVPQHLVPTLHELAGQVPVVLASRTGAGPVLAATYGFPGSERDLLARGLISAGLLNPYKARILLHTLVAADADRKTIEKAFAAASGLAGPEQWPWYKQPNAVDR